MRKTIMNYFALAAFLVTTLVSFGQVVLMGDPGFSPQNPADCNNFGVGGNNFFDNGAAGNYTANFNDTTVFCPDLTTGTKMSLTFGINAGYEFDVDGSDSIYVYDGPNTSAPLLGVHNSSTDPNGFSHIASWNNPSGCLTVVFISNGSVQGTGWVANAACGNQAQPFEPHIEAYVNGVGPDALNPSDTGFVDVCFGDSILFIARPLFPYSLESTGYGYSQNVDNMTYEWIISDGGTYPDNDSIWFTPPTRNGFLVDLKTTDEFPQSLRMLCKVRVSQLPSFAGTGPLEDTVCLGQNTTLIGGVTPTDTVGIDIPAGSFQLGGSFAGLTYLPDGSGAQYNAPIDIAGFPAGATINTAQDLNQVCITMEHSYLGDLEIALQCPNGTQVTLLNSYSPGFIPGGTSGGGTYLGDPIDDNGGGGPGEGWEYCFSSAFNTWGTYPTELGLGNTIPAPNFGNNGPSMNPNGVYLPETSFAALAGCPVNGQWTIIVQDNLTIDDGYIFEWGLFFDPSYFPGVSGYQNTIVTEGWLNDPTIISGQNDTLIVVQPNVPGNYQYTYALTDDFGCDYDTTVTLYVIPTAEIFDDTVACNFAMQVSGTQAFDDVVWFSPDPEITFSPNVNALNPLITTSAAGTYTVGFVDQSCFDTLYAQIIFPDLPQIFNDTSVCDLSFDVTGTDVYTTGGVWSSPSADVSFSPNANTTNPTISSINSGVYVINFEDNVCGNSTSTTIEFIGPPSILGDQVVCNYSLQITGTSSYNGGIWSASDTAIHFNDPQLLNPSLWASFHGDYILTFTDTVCNVSSSALIEVIPSAYVGLSDAEICAGSTYELTAISFAVDNFVWNTGNTGPTITVTQPGVYIVTGSNVCHSDSDTAVITTKVCDIAAPNIISLSSTVGNNLWTVDHTGLVKFHCIIVNRWGNPIYEFSDPNAGWNGRTQGGTLVEEGTYFYTIDATLESGEELQKQGFIQVVH